MKRFNLAAFSANHGTRRTVAAGFALVWLLGLLGCQEYPNQDRMWLDARINGHSVTMAVDTGASSTLLFQTAALDLGLKITSQPPDPALRSYQVVFGATEPCDLTIWGATTRAPLAVVKVPPYAHFDVDGVVGWPAVRDRIFQFDAAANKMTPLDKVPDDVATWTKLAVRSRFNIMSLEITLPDGSTGWMLVDTGSQMGVTLTPARWQEWRQAHPKEPVTMRAHYTPSTGPVAGEESWAHQLTLGPLVIHEVPVAEADPHEIPVVQAGANAPAFISEQYVGTLGMTALKRLDFILDGPQGVAYLRPKLTQPQPYEHNRIGAVFMPLDATSEVLTARVVPGSPADLAGIRNGDILTYINGHPAGQWREKTSVGLPNFEWQDFYDDKVFLRVIQGSEENRLTVHMQDIIGPGSPDFKSSLP